MDNRTTDRRIVVSETTTLTDAFRADCIRLRMRLREFADDVAEIILVLEQLMQEVKKEEKHKILGTRNDQTQLIHRSDYWYIRYYDLGNEQDAVSYRSNTWGGENALDKSLKLLIKRLQAACVIPPKLSASMGGRTEPLPGEGLFATYLPCIIGFYNFVPHWGDTNVLGDAIANFCANTFAQLHVSATLSSQDWQQLREAAANRLYTRFCCWLALRRFSRSELPYKSDKNFVYHRAYADCDFLCSSCMDNPIIASIIDGEEGRLRKFVDAFHGTLQVLSAMAALWRDVSPPEDTIAPETMTLFLRAVHAVLTGQAEVETVRYPFSTSVNATEAVTVVNSEPTAQDEATDLHRQVQVKEQELAQTKTELRIANQQVEELKEQLVLLEPQAMTEQALVSYYDYKRRLQEAARSKRVHGVWPQREIGFDSSYITTLVYSFDPSAVAFSLSELAAVEAGKRQAISKDAFWHFAGVLGYTNLYQYLLQSKTALLEKLVNLAVPVTEIPGVYMLDVDADSWLIGHLPPFAKVPNTPCYVILSSYGGRPMAQEIIAYEQSNLLDFRQSLCIAASVFAPAKPSKELDRLEQAFLPSEAVSHTATRSTSSDRRVRIVQEKHDSVLYSHHYFIEINDQANGISQPIEVDFVVDDEGTIIPPPEEEEA